MTSASLTAVPFATGTSVTAVNIAGVTAPSQGTITGSGYTVTFDVAAEQGVVSGMDAFHAIPVAGSARRAVSYLTGDFGSGRTTNAAQAGNYFSTGYTGPNGLSTITITFAVAQTSLALLWGSVDAGNQIAFLDAAGTVIDTLTGAQVQQVAAGFTGNGAQGMGGSAYVATTDSQTFTSVVFSSNVPSFEFAGVAASTTPFALPEPAALALFGTALAGVGLVGRRRPA